MIKQGAVHIVRKQFFDQLTSPRMQNDIIGTEYLGLPTMHSFENPSSMCVQFVIVSLLSTHLSKHVMVCEAQPFQLQIQLSTCKEAGAFIFIIFLPLVGSDSISW